ncbi:NAD-dependent epimerase/dehydratase family protein [Halomarina oriensis]|uniref:NAD-dependent epimerase/dehydratase family protein n=1 Tax=Halomarina oriensis TaxID=671145 RepID=A0A6B0GEF9_9EURY|nr:NAD-dependent epimerase/dehydratase family protein [Halomarina oriensis]MWG33192.1 NAD-dependent epimerase/dehydratase family protein [Halomarina oriensis]
MTDRALVTGATGFLGSHLVERLVTEGWDVTATRRENSDTSALDDLDVTWAEADVLDADAVSEAVAGHERVFHLAGIGLQAADAPVVERVNAEGTRNVLEAAQAADVERVVFTSTAGTRRRTNGIATEDDVADPIGAYQRGKAAAEELSDEFGERGLDVVTVHPTSIFGPRDEEFTGRLLSMASDPKMAVHPPGGASFVGVEDVVEGTVAAMDRGRPGEHYLLAGENLRYDEALDVIAAEIDGHAPLAQVPPLAIRTAGPVVGAVNRVLGTRMFPFDAEMARLSTRELFYSPRKAQRDLDYSYRPLRELVPEAWEWYRSEFHAAADE